METAHNSPDFLLFFKEKFNSPQDKATSTTRTNQFLPMCFFIRLIKPITPRVTKIPNKKARKQRNAIC